jgi:uncharacterized membrane protein YphA (DoxX/SURF4 family)
MKRLLLHPLMIWSCRLAVAAMLIYAAVQKTWMPLEFARLLKEYHLLPDQILNLVAVVLPWAEIICGICFISGLWLLGASILLSGMNTIFAFAIAYRAWLIMSETGINFFDLSFDCGCGFGVVYIPTKILENIILVSVGLLIAFSRMGIQCKNGVK